MFKKWISINNHYNEKYIQKFFTNWPQLYKETFCATEKIDGANFSIIISPDEIKFAKRSQLLGADSNFFDWQSIFCTAKENYKKDIVFLIEKIQKDYCLIYNCSIQLVGEIYGKGIQNRVNYGEGKYWRWYATYKGGILLSLNQEIEMVEAIGMHMYDLEDIRVPIISVFKLDKDETLIDAFDNKMDINRNTLLMPVDYLNENTMEGVVIRPFNEYYIGHDNFIIKYKNEKFKDIQNKSKVKKKVELSEEANACLTLLLYHVNENRTQDLVSKIGEFTDMSQMGEYIKAYIKDVYEDFNKLYPGVLKDLTDAEKKYINVAMTKQIVIELKGIL